MHRTQSIKPMPREGEIRINASQLRPGVHVRLPIPWLDHQFVFSSFVISDEDQARQIAALNLPDLFCAVTRCKVPPLPVRPLSLTPSPVNQETIANESIRLGLLAKKQMAEKIERSKAMENLRVKLDKAQKNFTFASKEIVGAFRSFDLDPKESIRQITQVSVTSTASLLDDPDSAIVLVSEKGQGQLPTTSANAVGGGL